MPLNSEQKRLITSITPLVGTFSGKSGFPAIQWLREFERVVQVYDTPQINLPVFKLLMKSSAADWLSKLSNEIQNDYQQIRTAFLERFVPNEFQDELEPLLRRKQLPSESIQNYADYFQEVLSHTIEPPSATKICKIFESQLLSDIHSRLSIRNWQNLDDLIAEAKLVESKLYLPLMNSSIPVTTQLTEALAYQQKESPSAIYHKHFLKFNLQPAKLQMSKKLNRME